MAIGNSLAIHIEQFSAAAESLLGISQPIQFLEQRLLSYLFCGVEAFMREFPIETILTAKGMGPPLRSIPQIALAKIHYLNLHIRRDVVLTSLGLASDFQEPRGVSWYVHCEEPRRICWSSCSLVPHYCFCVLGYHFLSKVNWVNSRKS